MKSCKATWAKKLPALFTSLMLGTLAFTSTVRAGTEEVIYNNLGAPSSGLDQVLYFGPLFDSFTPAVSGTITSLQLALDNFSAGGSGNLSVGLYTMSTLDSSAVPTLITNLGTIANSAIATGGVHNYSIPVTAFPALTAGTRYWIGLNDYADGSITWSWTADASSLGVPGEYWANDGGNVHPNSSPGPYQMSLSITPGVNVAVYNNLGAASGGQDQILSGGPLFDSFTATANETLNGLKLALGNYGPPGNSSNLTVGLYTLSTLDSSAVPTLITTLGTISNSIISTAGINDYSVSLQTHPSLTAGTRYWIGLTDYNDGSITWSWSSDLSGGGVAGEYWANDGGNVHSNSIQGPYQMALFTSPIPKGTIYNNLGASSGGLDQILYVGPLFDSFTAAANETISSLQLALGNYGPAGSGNLTVGLYTLSTLNSSAVPTLIAPLGTIPNSAIATTGINNYSVSLQTHPSLTAGTRYWIGLSDYDDGAITWSWSSDLSGTGLTGEYWANDGGNVHPNSSQGPFQMLLAATPVMPNLTITPAGHNLVVAWPNSSNCILQQNNSATASAGWTPCSYPVTTNNVSGTNSITITTPTGNLFFRLAAPSGM